MVLSRSTPVSSTGDKDIDPKSYGQVQTQHFLAVHAALESVKDRLSQISSSDYDSERTLNIIQDCGHQLFRIEEVSQRVASGSGAISDFVFDRIRYLKCSIFELREIKLSGSPSPKSSLWADAIVGHSKSVERLSVRDIAPG
jgi:hypothetical protein